MSHRSSASYFNRSDLELDRSRKKHISPTFRSKVAHQVEDLHDTLQETNASMAENERMLSHCHRSSRLQDIEMDELHHELERTRELLRQEKRVELENARTVSALEASLQYRQATPMPSTHQKLEEMLANELKDVKKELHLLQSSKKEEHIEELAQELRSIKAQLHDRGKRENLHREVKELESELLGGSTLLSSSLRQSESLANCVGKLGVQLHQTEKQKKEVQSQLEAATIKLNERLGGREQLLRQLSDLRQSLSISEEQRVIAEQQFASLRTHYKDQEQTQDRINHQLTDIEARQQYCRTERNDLEEHCQQLKQKLSSKLITEEQIQAQCDTLQKQLSEREIMEREVKEKLTHKISILEQQYKCSELKTSQLKAEVSAITLQKDELQTQVESLKEKLEHSEKNMDREVSLLKSQLCGCQEENRGMDRGLISALEKLQQKAEENQVLHRRVAELEAHLASADEEKKSTYSRAKQALHIYKLKYKQLQQDHQNTMQEKQDVMNHTSDLERQLLDYQTELEKCAVPLASLEHANELLHDRVRDLETQDMQQALKNQELLADITDLKSSLNESQKNSRKCLAEVVKQRGEIDAERVSLNKLLEEKQLEVQTLLSQLQEYQVTANSNIEQLQLELDSVRDENSKLILKSRKLIKACQCVKRDLSESQSLELERKQECQKLMEKFEQSHVQLIMLSKKDEEVVQQVAALKISHCQELEQMKQTHCHLQKKLEHSVTQLQVKLTDEQSTVQAIRRQQYKTLDDNYKIGDEFSRSIDDTEKLRLKYLSAKKYYEDMYDQLETDVGEVQHEECKTLRQKLATSQKTLIQLKDQYETVLRATANEVDVLVAKIGQRLHIPVLPKTVHEMDVRKWVADIMAKLRWLIKELDEIFLGEELLKRKVHDQKVTAFGASARKEQ